MTALSNLAPFSGNTVRIFIILVLILIILIIFISFDFIFYFLSLTFFCSQLFFVTFILFSLLILFCSCREQIRYIGHKRYLTLVRNLLSRLPPGPYVSPVDIAVWIGWTRGGLPAEETLKLKSVKSLRKSNLVIRRVMNAYR